MYVDENVSTSMWRREEWIMWWLSTIMNYAIILQSYGGPMNDISEE